MRPLHLLAAFLLAVPPAAQEHGSRGALGPGLDAIDSARIEADVRFFSDDMLAGRDTPSPGLRTAARFVRARLERLGFTPGAGDGFFHTYRVSVRRIDPELTRLVLRAPEDDASEDLVFGRDYFVYSSKHVMDVDVEGGLVACGDGTKAELEGLDLSGRWALALAGDTSVTRRARNVERAGALGLLVLTGPGGGDERFDERLERTAETATRGIVSLAKGKEARTATLPMVFLSRDASARVLALAGVRTAPAPGTELPLIAHEVRTGSGVVDVENVCGLWPGSDPELSREVLIVSAHYDHIGARGDAIYNGADDNASGSMGLLALAEALAAQGPLRRSVLLLWVSGEEKGLWGSGAWTEDPVLPAGAVPVCDLNIDMIGRNAPDSVLITPSPDHVAYGGLSRLVHELAASEGFRDVGSADAYWSRSDHMNFERNLGIPVAFLFSGEHADYHRQTDTAEKIDYDKIQRVTRLVFRVLCALQDDELSLQ